MSSNLATLEQRVAAGDAAAMDELAFIFYSGEGVPKDVVRAKELYERAVEANNASAMRNLGDLLRHEQQRSTEDIIRAKELYERAIDAGNIRAMVKLGDLLRYGDSGVPKDVVRAIELYERAVDAGNLKAMYRLGIHLMLEQCCLRDVLRAQQLLKRAVDGGYVKAMCFFAFLLTKGPLGVPKDGVRAKELYERAVVAGSGTAIYNLAKLLEHGADGVPKDTVRAEKLFVRAASRGQARARSALARLREDSCSILSTAFCHVMCYPDMLDEAFLVEYVRASHVASAVDLLAGHNLALLSVRLGVLAGANHGAVGDSRWYFQENLYLPASELSSRDDILIKSVLLHAENVGLVKNGFTSKARPETRDCMHRGVQSISRILRILACRTRAVEQLVSPTEEASRVREQIGSVHSKLAKVPIDQETSQSAVTNFARNLEQLPCLVQKGNPRVMHIWIMKCIFSLISVVGAVTGNAPHSAADLFMHLSVDHPAQFENIVPGCEVSRTAFVDLSSIQTARLIMSEKVIAGMSPGTQTAVTDAICESGLQSAQTLESLLHEQTASSRRGNR